MSRPLPNALRCALALSCAAPALLTAPAFAQQTAAPFARGSATTLEEISVEGARPVPSGRPSGRPSAPPPRAEPPAEPTPLQDVTVSATGVPTPVVNTGSSVTIIPAEVLQQQQRRTVPEALQQVPGLNVVPIGGPGGQTSVFIRGANSNQVKAFVDGIDISDPSNPNASVDFGQLLTDDLSRIEVLRGPQSGLYGADAIGGVISLVTRRGEGPTRITARVEGGSYGTFNQVGRISGAENGFDYSVTVAHFRAAETPVTPRDLVLPGRPRYPNYYDNETVSAKLGYQFTDEFRVNSVTRFVASKLLFSGDDFSPFPLVAVGALRGQANVEQIFSRNEAEWTPFVGFHNIFAINYSNIYNENKQRIYDPLAPAPSTNIGERMRYEYRGDYLLAPGNLILFGAQRDEESLNNVTSLGRTIRAANGNTGGYAEAQLSPFERAFLVANVRHDDNDAFGAATTYRVAPSYIVPYSETRIRGSVGTGFKAPTLNQLFVNIPASSPFGFSQVGNPNLRPEESFGYDAGLEQPFGDRVLTGATYYANDFKNLIVGQVDPVARTFSSVNRNRAESYGAEAFIAVRFSDTLSGRVDYTNTVTKAQEGALYRELLRRPRHKGSATVLWNPLAGLTVSGTLIALGNFVDGGRADPFFARIKNPGFVVVNLAAEYQIDETLSVFGRVDNLFDRRYENPNGFLGAGLSVYGGVRLTTF